MHRGRFQPLLMRQWDPGFVAESHRPAHPTGWRRVAFRLPIQLYRLRLGGLLGARFVLIHHTGRRSHLPRQVVVEIVTRDRATGAVIVASGFGPRSDWYRNLLATPEASIELGWRRLDVHAEPLTPEQAGQTMVDYAHRHPRAAKSLARFMGYQADGSDENYRAMGDTLPMLRLTPR
jgi:deazaflavin-dependent oxidoreductase (nitroreductase family)